MRQRAHGQLLGPKRAALAASEPARPLPGTSPPAAEARPAVVGGLAQADVGRRCPALSALRWPAADRGRAHLITQSFADRITREHEATSLALGSVVDLRAQLQRPLGEIGHRLNGTQPVASNTSAV